MEHLLFTKSGIVEHLVAYLVEELVNHLLDNLQVHLLELVVRHLVEHQVKHPLENLVEHSNGAPSRLPNGAPNNRLPCVERNQQSIQINSYWSTDGVPNGGGSPLGTPSVLLGAPIGAHSLGKGRELNVAPHGLYIGAPDRAPQGYLRRPGR